MQNAKHTTRTVLVPKKNAVPPLISSALPGGKPGKNDDCKLHRKQCEGEGLVINSCHGALRELGPYCSKAELASREEQNTCEAFYELCALEICDIMDESAGKDDKKPELFLELGNKVEEGADNTCKHVTCSLDPEETLMPALEFVIKDCTTSQCCHRFTEVSSSLKNENNSDHNNCKNGQGHVTEFKKLHQRIYAIQPNHAKNVLQASFLQHFKK